MSDDPNAKVFHVSHRGVRHGPFSRVDLSARSLTHDMLVWREGMAEWVPIAEVPELRPYVKHVTTLRTTVPPRGPAPRPQEVPVPVIVPPPPPAPPPRSVAATTIGITHIVIASLTMICWPLAIVGTLAGNDPAGPLADVLGRPLVRSGQIASLGLGFVLAVPMLIAGIGLVRRRSWGRLIAIFGACFGLALQVVSFIFMLVAAVLPLAEIAAELEDPNLMGGAFGVLIGTVLGSCGGVIYDAVVLFVMGNASVKRSLA